MFERDPIRIYYLLLLDSSTDCLPFAEHHGATKHAQENPSKPVPQFAAGIYHFAAVPICRANGTSIIPSRPVPSVLLRASLRRPPAGRLRSLREATE